jgi:hypothetical protein
MKNRPALEARARKERTVSTRPIYSLARRAAQEIQQYIDDRDAGRISKDKATDQIELTVADALVEHEVSVRREFRQD